MDPLRGPGPWTGYIKIWTGSMDPLSWTASRENDGTEREIEGVGWDKSIPLKLF